MTISFSQAALDRKATDIERMLFETARDSANNRARRRAAARHNVMLFVATFCTVCAVCVFF